MLVYDDYVYLVFVVGVSKIVFFFECYVDCFEVVWFDVVDLYEGVFFRVFIFENY